MRTIESLQIQSLRAARKRNGEVDIPLAIIPINAGPPPKKCQWIEGEPTDIDDCKCLAPVKFGLPYCEEHCERAYRSGE